MMQPSSRLPAAQETMPLSVARVLLVEDEFLIRLILAEALTGAGYEVAEAENGDEAVSLLDGPDGFDVLVTDIQMPGGIDGLALARRVRTAHPNTSVVYMTGRPEVMNRIGRLGPREALVRKPYGPSEILETIQRLLIRAGGSETGTPG